jgi:hypothetical protein
LVFFSGYHDIPWAFQALLKLENKFYSRHQKMLPLRSLTMQGAVSIEITEIIWICNVMGFFFKFGKQIEENIGFNI